MSTRGRFPSLEHHDDLIGFRPREVSLDKRVQPLERVRGDVAVTEFRYQPLGWPEPRRFITIRRPVPEGPSWQLSLFRLGKFVYQVIVTNLDLTPVNLWRFYNDPRAG